MACLPAKPIRPARACRNVDRDAIGGLVSFHQVNGGTCLQLHDGAGQLVGQDDAGVVAGHPQYQCRLDLVASRSRPGLQARPAARTRSRTEFLAMVATQDGMGRVDPSDS